MNGCAVAGCCEQVPTQIAIAPPRPAVDDAFYLPEGSGPDGHRYLSTPLTAGPWDPGAQHAGPPIALVATAMEHQHPRGDARMVRVTADILGPVPVAPVTVTTTLARPGRGVELLAGSLSAEGRQVLGVHAWRIRMLAGSDPTPPQIPDGPPPPGPDSGHPDPYIVRCGHGYLAAMEWRFLTGAFNQPGPGAAWLRMRHPLIAGEEPTPLARVLVAADSGNGISNVLDFRDYLFINADLTVHLVRYPAGEWVCLQSVTFLDGAGVGLADTALYDDKGQIGRAAQSLFVGPRRS